MSADVLVPAVIPAEVDRLIQELGLRRAVEEMIEHTRQAVTGLRAIEVEAWYEQDVDDRPPMPHLTIIAWHDGPRAPADEATEREWFAWCARRYPRGEAARLLCCAGAG